MSGLEEYRFQSRIVGLLVSLVTALSVAVCAMGICADRASAVLTHKYLSSFGGGSLAGGVQSIATDDASGDVYVYVTERDFTGHGFGGIYKFNSAGEPANFTATGTNLLEGVGGHENGGQIAVDNSLTSHTKGDIYVANEAGLSVYASSGELVGALSVAELHEHLPEPGNLQKCKTEQPGSADGTAVDGEGHVYVRVWPCYVEKFTPTGAHLTNSDYTSLLIPEKGQQASEIAVDSEGDVYEHAGNNPGTYKYGASQFTGHRVEGTLIAEAFGGLAVDESTNDFYLNVDPKVRVNEGGEILVFDSTGKLREKVTPQAGTVASFTDTAIAVSDASGDVYVGGGANNSINVFSPPVVVPDATTEAAAVTATTVTLKGTVNPDGIEASCYFEYGPTNAYGHTAPCSSSPGSGSSPVAVSVELSGLEPAVVYHYRLVASNVNGASAGTDVTFALAFPPAVGGESSASVEETTAVIDASISPFGFDTTYRVEYGPTNSYGSNAPVPDADAGAATHALSVSQELTGLTPGTTYHFRVVATNADGTAQGGDATFTTFSAPGALSPDSCPNAGYRIGASAGLPDCRAYEMVSPVDKNGADVNAQAFKQFVASVSGNRVEYMTRTGMGDTHGSGEVGYTEFIATRGTNGWSTKALFPTPPLDTPLEFGGYASFVQDFSEELDRVVLSAYDVPGVGGKPVDQQNLYVESSSNIEEIERVTHFEGFEEPVTYTSWEEGTVFGLGGSSGDLQVITFQSKTPLTEPAAGGGRPQVYAFEHGKVTLVSILPNGSVPGGGAVTARPAAGAGFGNTGAVHDKDTVSKDGSRIFFMSPAVEGQLYMRRNASETVFVSQSEASAPTEAKEVRFGAATPDGKHVVFSTPTRLLDGDPGGPGRALYLYTDSPHPQNESNLTYIGRYESTTDFGAGEDEIVKGISQDGSHVYFASMRTAELPFKTDSSVALFLWDSGHIRQVAPTVGGVNNDYNVNVKREALVSADGTRIAFMNDRSLTGYPAGFEAKGAMPNGLFYVYDEASDTLKCVSCPSTGAAVTTGDETEARVSNGGGGDHWEDMRVHFFSDDGRYVFFNTKEALLPQDVNGVTDAYEYNVDTGKLSLLSTGTGETGTWFVDASADGHDVFLATRQQLSRWDPDKLVDLYDARVEGGLPEPPLPGFPCAGDACQGIPSAAPSFSTASEFNGLGNPSWLEGDAARAKSLTRGQLLRRALALCRKKKGRHARVVCREVAHRQYAKSKSAKRAARSGR